MTPVHLASRPDFYPRLLEWCQNRTFGILLARDVVGSLDAMAGRNN